MFSAARSLTRRGLRVVGLGVASGSGAKVWRQGKGGSELIDVVVQGRGEMPEPRRLDLPLLEKGQDERFYLEQFMAKFGVGPNETALIEAPSGHCLAVSRLLFTDHKTGGLKIAKQGRAPYVPYIADTIMRPGEIWLNHGSAGDRALYLLAWYLIGRKETAMLTVFKEQRKVWEGWSGYQTTNMTYLDTKRVGLLAYRTPKR